MKDWHWKTQHESVLVGLLVVELAAALLLLGPGILASWFDFFLTSGTFLQLSRVLHGSTGSGREADCE